MSQTTGQVSYQIVKLVVIYYTGLLYYQHLHD